MMYLTHIGVSVDNVLEARDFYQKLFSLEIYVQEALTKYGWRSLPPKLPDEKVEQLGFKVGMVVLQRESFALSVQLAGSNRAQLLEHAAIAMDQESFQTVREIVLQLQLPVVYDDGPRFVFVDKFGMVWELTVGHLLLTARDMGYGEITADGTVSDGPRGLNLNDQ